MKTAFTVWNHRIAPLFDAARRIHLVVTVRGAILSRTTIAFIDPVPEQKVRQLVEMGVGGLVCGAISTPVAHLVTAYGIDLTADVQGDLETVIAAWQERRLGSDAFRMPGCRGRSRRRDRGAAAPDYRR
jgi:predicted Fe-Mo cluster-binding NifX family protein